MTQSRLNRRVVTIMDYHLNNFEKRSYSTLKLLREHARSPQCFPYEKTMFEVGGRSTLLPYISMWINSFESLRLMTISDFLRQAGDKA